MRFWIWNLIGLVALIGCDTREQNHSPAALPQVIEGEGAARGQVRFIGTAPVMRQIRNQPCHPEAEPIMEETVVVNDNGTLRNVLVYLEGAPATDGSGAQSALLDQVNCRYVPHVLGVQAGQKITVRSSDPTLHNVHCITSKNRAVNFGMTGAGQERTITFSVPELITVKCDVHPWMTAYVRVFENRWFTVTDETGSFEIKGIPAGSYTLATWHEQYGRLEQSVTISDDRPVEVSFEYKAP